MEPEIVLLPQIPRELDALDVTPDGAWVGVSGPSDQRKILFGGHSVQSGIACKFPLICALDPETAALVDARTLKGVPNAWIVRASGEQLATFEVGDAVEGVAAVGGRLVVTHFDVGICEPASRNARVRPIGCADS
jgi:hypothetical protein